MTAPVGSKTVRMTGEQRREQIIDAAIELFSTGGFSRTTTRRIAESAGVSEAALYLHFETKEALYEAIIRRKAVQNAGLTERLIELSEAPPDQVFRTVAEFMLETHTRDKAFLRLLFFSGLEGHALFRMFFEAQMRECGDRLLSYVERQQRAGLLRPCEPRLAVRAFMGMLIHHLLVQEIFKLHEMGTYPADAVASLVVTIFLDGMVPRDGGPVEPNGGPCA